MATCETSTARSPRRLHSPPPLYLSVSSPNIAYPVGNSNGGVFSPMTSPVGGAAYYCFPHTGPTCLPQRHCSHQQHSERNYSRDVTVTLPSTWPGGGLMLLPRALRPNPSPSPPPGASVAMSRPDAVEVVVVPPPPRSDREGGGVLSVTSRPLTPIGETSAQTSQTQSDCSQLTSAFATPPCVSAVTATSTQPQMVGHQTALLATATTGWRWLPLAIVTLGVLFIVGVAVAASSRSVTA